MTRLGSRGSELARRANTGAASAAFSRRALFLACRLDRVSGRPPLR